MNAADGPEPHLLTPSAGRLLGHTTTTTTKRYAYLADDTLRAAADRFGSKIADMQKGRRS